MRIIGQLENESKARVFSNYLVVRGVPNQVEAESDGTWTIWVHGEDELKPARELFLKYQANPNDPEVLRAAEKAAEVLEQQKKVEEAAAKRFYTKNQIFRPRGFMGMGPVTLVLAALSIVGYLLIEFQRQNELARTILSFLFISLDANAKDLPEVTDGQFWRLLTPIFLHFHILHIFFNVMWMRDLGSMIESRLGSGQLITLVVFIGVGSNLVGYEFIGPGFGGMSGVIYGLFGYVWMKGKYDPGSGLFLHPSTVSMMMIWFVLCFFINMGNGPFKIANSVHSGGLIMGTLWGYLSALRRSAS